MNLATSPAAAMSRSVTRGTIATIASRQHEAARAARPSRDSRKVASLSCQKQGAKLAVVSACDCALFNQTNCDSLPQAPPTKLASAFDSA